MASVREILAGRAAVEIALRDKLKAGLDVAQNRLRRFAVEVAAIGISFNTLASIASRAMSIVTDSFTGPAAIVNDIADRTGLSVETIQTLGEVAAETGASIEDVQTAAKGMANLLYEAAKGGDSANEVLSQLGLTVADLQGQSPDEQMLRLADALSTISDPTIRAATAQKVFGRSAQRLIPLLSMGRRGIEAYRKQLEEAGVIRTPEQIDIADRIGEAWERAVRRIKAVGFSALSAIAPALESISLAFVGVVEAVNRWVQANPTLARTLGIVFAVVLAGVAVIATFTAAMLAAGLVFSALGTAWTILTAAWAAASAVIGVLMTPMGLVVALAVAAVAVFAALAGALLYFTGTGQKVLAIMSAGIGAALAFFKQVIGGILDALAVGNFTLAGKIAMAGVSLAFTAGMGELKMLWASGIAWMAEQLSSLAKAAKEAFSGIPGFWEGAVAGLGITGGMAGMGEIGNIERKWADGLADQNNAAITQAAKELDDLTKQAADARKAREDALKVPKSEELPDAAELDIGKAEKARAATADAVGTFSARIAGSLASRRFEQVWDRIAEGNDRQADALEELNAKIKGGMLAVVP